MLVITHHKILDYQVHHLLAQFPVEDYSAKKLAGTSALLSQLVQSLLHARPLSLQHSRSLTAHYAQMLHYKK